MFDKSIKEKYVFYFVTILALLVGIFFRIYNLNYSEFQGDEVSAQNFLFGEQNFSNFLLTRTIQRTKYNCIHYKFILF